MELCSAAVCLASEVLILSEHGGFIGSEQRDPLTLRTLWRLGPVLRCTHTIQLDERAETLSARMELFNDGPPVSIRSVRPLVVLRPGAFLTGTRPAQWSLFRDGRTKNALPCTYGFLRDRGRRQEALCTWVEDGDGEPSLVASGGDLTFRSEHFLVMKRRDKAEALLVGFTTLRDQFSQIQLTTNDAETEFRGLEAICQTDGVTLEQGATLSSESLLLDGNSDPLAAIEHYAERVAAENHARRPEGIPTGWCSWYFYFSHVREDDVLENLDFLASRRWPVRYVQVDEGWNDRHGDWEPNEKFPHGMAWLAGEIRGRGLLPGIWVAPFLVHPDSRVAREHPEWLLRDDRGRLIEPHSSMEPPVLDPAVPAVQQYLRALGHRLVHQWGYQYVKADFVRAVSLVRSARFHANVTRAQAVRIGMEALREGMGSSAVLLACGGPYGPTLGVADGNRTGADTLPEWSTFIWGARQSIPRWHMHERWWFNDSDNLCVRDNAEPFRGIPQSVGRFTEEEVRTAVTLLYLSGGSVMIGERLSALSEERRRLIDLVLPPLGVAARPRDMFSEPIPTILDAQVVVPFGTWHTVGIVNWQDEARARTETLHALCDCPADALYHVYEFWTKRYHGRFRSDDRIELGLIAPHGCRLLLVKRVEAQPQLVSTDAHLSQGAVEIEGCRLARDGLAVAARRRLRPIRALLYFPNGWRAEGLALDSTGLAWIELQPGESRLIKCSGNTGCPAAGRDGGWSNGP